MGFVLLSILAAISSYGSDAILLRQHSAEDKCVPPGMRAVTTVNGFRMVVLGDDDIVSKSFAHSGFWEIRTPEDMIPEEMKLKGMSLPEKGTLLDIGANIGDYTLLFASRGYNVIAVEPMTRNRAALQASLCLNPEFKDRVKVVPAALVAPDEVQGRRCIIKSTNYEINVGNGYLTCGADKEVKACEAGDANCEEVPVKTLSTALAELNVTAIDVVKMDVENFECHVFAGGESLFTKYHPKLLQVETMWGHTGQCVADMANKFSYNTVKVGENTEMVAKSETAKSRIAMF
jgi:FkbM family methyltransferase